MEKAFLYEWMTLNVTQAKSIVNRFGYWLLCIWHCRSLESRNWVSG